MATVFRLYSEKKPGFAVEANGVCHDLKTNLMISGLREVRIFHRYDVEGITEEVFNRAINTVFSEPQVDTVYRNLPEVSDARVFAIEYLPGQFDQRADSAAQCVQLLTTEERPLVKSATVYYLMGELSDKQFEKIKTYLINPVEAREASLAAFETLAETYDIPNEVAIIEDFIDFDAQGDQSFLDEYSLAMDLDDVRFCREYFKNGEHRNPTVTELRMIDTYWSDHCRHTTFGTILKQVELEPEFLKSAYQNYCEIRERLYVNRPDKQQTLMDIATIGAKELKRRGLLKNLDESEEINACSIKIPVCIDGEDVDYLLMFKNETHNHPTEIEPFGGAATCLGGAIRDPLSGRSYVYQAMRVTGAADPRLPADQTMKGKLSQRKLVTTAANGYSSYGNQIGLATGYVNEVYHKNYVAKRLEIGAVLGAAPFENVRRERPLAGDIIILLGGATGRDGCGGATGSSKSHTCESLKTCGAEVQKGNPPEERKLQRLFRNAEVTRLIKRCNDFGAGGVSVAIGELADGLIIDLDAIPKKYDGLDGTELAISESQERMAVVVAPEDVERFQSLAATENLDAVVVAKVTEEARLRMDWKGKRIVDLSREFLNSNGASKETDVAVTVPNLENLYKGFTPSGSFGEKLKTVLSDLNICSQKGLVERFDGSIGAGSVTMPFGGKTQLTPVQNMIGKIPVLHGETNTSSVMAYGFNPFISEKSPYHGAVLAIVESVARVVASGASHRDAYLTLQEYFERTKGEPTRWGKPFAALLGALSAQLGLEIGAIGGKDSMSGTFEDIDVPPTLVSFAVSVLDAAKALTPEFKAAGNHLYLFAPKLGDDSLPTYESLHQIFDQVHQLAENGTIVSAWALGMGGIGEAVAKMAIGNRLGFAFDSSFDESTLFAQQYGAILVESSAALSALTYPASLIGEITDDACLKLGAETVSLDELQAAFCGTLEDIFPTKAAPAPSAVPTISFAKRSSAAPAIRVAKPRVTIPVFPGTNCEYDSMRVFERAGAEVSTRIIANQHSSWLAESIEQLEKSIRNSQIVMLPGGFSGGDEPEGSAKFICAVFRNPYIREAVTDLLENRDGLMIGICNGFQALIKLGLLPSGRILDTDADCPTLTFNNIGRHQSMMVSTRIASVKSPWLSHVEVGDIHTVAISHGEGRFVANDTVLKSLIANGQVATQYVDLAGVPTADMPYNPNGSVAAIEGILSPDGRVLGKMAHSERVGSFVAKNIDGNKDQHLFVSGVEYFK